MKGLTERQIRRREKILSATRDLLTKYGVEGVTMRRLAQESGVTPKTLYHQFGSKENLLQVAVEERFRYYYRMIDEEPVAHGVDRMLHIIDTVAATAHKNKAYARALAPLISSSIGSAIDDSFESIRQQTYRLAVDQIAAEGEFQPWVDVDLVASIIYRQISPLSIGAWFDQHNWQKVPKMTKLEVCLILDSVTTGYSNKKAVSTVKAMHKELSQRKNR